MFKSLLAAAFVVTLAGPAWAASDDELAQKCITGMKTVAPNGAQISYLSGGGLEGLLRRGAQNIVIRGTWEVKNGVMTFHSQGETGPMVTNSFPVRMDASGKCFMTTPGGERPIEK
jgi:hypothetical protein